MTWPSDPYMYILGDKLMRDNPKARELFDSTNLLARYGPTSLAFFLFFISTYWQFCALLLLFNKSVIACDLHLALYTSFPIHCHFLIASITFYNNIITLLVTLVLKNMIMNGIQLGLFFQLLLAICIGLTLNERNMTN